MTKLNRKEPFLFLAGDLAFLILSLWITLLIRYSRIPSRELFYGHLAPFSLLFVAWILIFFIAGLYEKRMLILERELPGTLLRAHIANIAVAVLFFYLFPFYSITPKTNLFIDLGVSFLLILAWRLVGAAIISVRSREQALIIGRGKELAELRDEVNRSRRFTFRFVEAIDLDSASEEALRQKISDTVSRQGISIIVVDLADPRIAPALPRLTGLLFAQAAVIEFASLYEDVFERIPLPMLSYKWFLENISTSRKYAYDAFKRLMDIGLSVVVGIVCLVILPFVWIAIKIQDGGPIFILQERVGKGAKVFRLWKFRSSKSHQGDKGKWVEAGDTRFTKVGLFLRKSRIDELPQVWAVIKGDMSLIGPRPDILSLGLELAEQIPYYNMRYAIKPGLSGWAQISQKLPPQSLEETKLRLSYDFYYIKNRSFALDLKIALRTIQTLLSRLGV